MVGLTFLFSSLVTLALNVASPVLWGEYGKAAFDAVGPVLLIGWAEVGPGLLRALAHIGVPSPEDKQTANITPRGVATGDAVGRDRRAPSERDWALIVTAVYSRYMFVWLTFSGDPGRGHRRAGPPT